MNLAIHLSIVAFHNMTSDPDKAQNIKNDPLIFIRVAGTILGKELLIEVPDKIFIIS